jgi:hypothetical protein
MSDLNQDVSPEMKRICNQVLSTTGMKVTPAQVALIIYLYEQEKSE